MIFVKIERRFWWTCGSLVFRNELFPILETDLFISDGDPALRFCEVFEIFLEC